MKLPITRRLFLGATGQAGLYLGTSGFALGHAVPRPTNDLFPAEWADLVSRLRDAPRAECVPLLLHELAGGEHYERVLTALFLLSTSYERGQRVAYGLHATHRLGVEADDSDRLVPILVAFDEFKRLQDRDELGRPFTGRTQDEGDDPRAGFEALWADGSAPFGAASLLRLMPHVGLRHAARAIRFLQSDTEPTRSASRELADAVAEDLPRTWSWRVADEASRELCNALLRGRAREACELGAQQLASGVTSGAVWDAIHLAGCALRADVRNAIEAAHATFYSSAFQRTRVRILFHALASVADHGRKAAANRIRHPLRGRAPGASNPQEIFGAIRHRVLRSASSTHAFEVLRAAQESVYRVSPAWQPYLLAAARRDFPPTGTPASEVYRAWTRATQPTV
ncbi:MAG: hypothetical protein GY711_14670 [bacterium]|nr:hypothetical protein [bacterium]